MMRRIVILLIITYIIAFLGMLAELFYKFSGDRDTLWHYEWIIESFWFSLFSVFLFVMMVLMRPNERSKLLAMVE